MPSESGPSTDKKVIAQFAIDLLDGGHPVEEFYVLLSQKPSQDTIDESMKAAGILSMIEAFSPQHTGRLREVLANDLRTS